MNNNEMNNNTVEISFIDTNTNTEVTLIPIFNIPIMSDEKWRELSEKKPATPKMIDITKETELTLKSIITEDYIEASKNILSNLTLIDDTSKLPIDQLKEIISYINLIQVLYEVDAARHIIFNPNTKNQKDSLDRLLEIEKELAAVSPKFAKKYAKFEQKKAELMPELIAYYNGDINLANRVAEDLAYAFIYNN